MPNLRPWARGAFLLVMVASATACLLVDIPFTYQAVIRAGLLPWLPTAMRLQPWALLLVIVGNALVDRQPLGFSLPRRRAWYWGAMALGVLALFPFAGLSLLTPGFPARLGTLAFLAAAGTLLALDLIEARGSWPQREAGSDDARRLFVSALLTAALVTLAFFAIGLGRALASGTTIPPKEAATTLGWSFLAHALVLSMAAVALLGLQAAAGFFPRLRAAEFLLMLSTLTATFAGMLTVVVFPGIAFAGPFAWAVALLLGFCVTALLAQLGLGARPVGSALEVFLRPLHPARVNRWSVAAGLLLALGVALLFGLKVSRFDWNQLFQQLGAILVAILVFTPIYLSQSAAPGPHSWSPRLFAAPLILLALFRLWGTPLPQPTKDWLPRPVARVVEAHTGFDASAHLVANLLRPPAGSGESIYRTLLANSNIPHAVKVDAKDLRFVEPLTAGTAVDRPDIYIFVVDSLRQDYLGAYNPRVTFTPNLDRFAAESTVIPKAFTRYGATGLSEPSIWVGGMILHKQYIVPFHPLNTLQKLVEAHGYRPYLSMDSILDVVVKPTPDLVRLDAGIGTGDLRLGATLKDLQGKLDQAPAGRPVFVYSQAQDLHISSISREGKDVPGGGDYPGFYAPYASRLRRLDAAFGAFIQYLKDRGRYDRSLIIFTADHGDSLGEEGRFGHAYTLFPEIMKVPLLLHVPEKLRAGLVMDPKQPAFLTDITPTLYYLLGHRPLASDAVLGRPLWTQTQAEQTRARRDHHLIASSYGAVWGILSGDGKTLYVSDGVNFADHCFDLGSDPKGTRVTVTPELKHRYDRLILQEIDHLNAFYAFTPGKGSP
ncbi:MAG: sulfatase-like hydrolase/transferase [Holophagaceae bacterium]|nr:sulfatase-like hydrolase/transferase [Holophagaceae bacterium]